MASYISSFLWGSKSTEDTNGSTKHEDTIPQVVVNGDAADGDTTPHGSPKPTEQPHAIDGVKEAKVLPSDGAFPLPNSQQRFPDTPAAPSIAVSSPTSSPTLASPDRNMPPPPVPSGGLKATVKAQKKALKRQLREALAPGHSQMDWAILKTKGLNLRGVDQIMRVTPSMLAKHNTKEDAWSVFFGKVYNITPYLSYHPGGEKKLLRVAGKDGTRLFVHSHEWINVEAMMDECFVGFLVPEPAAEDD